MVTQDDTKALAAEAKDIAAPVDDSVWQSFNEWQLWSIFIALDRDTSVEPLKTATSSLAAQAKSYGIAHYDWIK